METILSMEEINNENLRMHLEEETLIYLNQYPKDINRKKLLDMIGKDFTPNFPIDKNILENKGENLCL